FQAVSQPAMIGSPIWQRTIGPASLGCQINFMFQPGRPVSTTSRRGRYESIADSTPVHLTEQPLRHIHQNTGLPWWASTVCTTVPLRTVVTLPPGAYKVVILTKALEIAELAKRLRLDEKTLYQFKKNLKRIVSELYAGDNCHPFKASLLVWVQLPMWVLGVSDDLTVGGALWFFNLTLYDSTCLPGLFSLRRTEASRFQKYVTNFVRGITLVMMLCVSIRAHSMTLYWLTSSCVGLGHNLLLRSPHFRRLCGIASTRSNSDTPYRDIASSFVSKHIKSKRVGHH
uniref:Cytochrome c oxidase assembly factor COX18 n=1 Tax=Salmo trutta TaxID=8032 RepID=A0A673YJC9_SALTR